MNLPPEPDDPELLDRMQDGLEAVGRDLVSLMRYQGFGGVQADKDAASNWLSRRALVPPQERLFIVAGRPSGAAGHPRPRRQTRRCRAVGSPHLSRHPLDRGAARPQARRAADGRRRRRRRRLCRRVRAAGAEGALSQSDAAESDDPSRSASSGGGSPSPRSPAGSACRSSRTIPTAFFPIARATAVRRDRAGAHLARRGARQMPRRRPARRLRRGAGHALGLAVRGRAPHRDGDGLAADRRAGDAVDRRRHRRRAARRGTPGVDRAPAPRRGDPAEERHPHRSDRFPSVGVAAAAMDAVRLCRAHALDRHRRRRERRVRDRAARHPRRCGSASAVRRTVPRCAMRSSSWRTRSQKSPAMASTFL